jgi:hypothetical protein
MAIYLLGGYVVIGFFQFFFYYKYLLLKKKLNIYLQNVYNFLFLLF